MSAVAGPRLKPYMVCQGDPCWCGGHREAPRDPSLGTWSQEAEDRFFAERKADRARRAELEAKRSKKKVSA